MAGLTSAGPLPEHLRGYAATQTPEDPAGASATDRAKHHELGYEVISRRRRRVRTFFDRWQSTFLSLGTVVQVVVVVVLISTVLVAKNQLELTDKQLKLTLDTTRLSVAAQLDRDALQIETEILNDKHFLSNINNVECWNIGGLESSDKQRLRKILLFYRQIYAAQKVGVLEDGQWTKTCENIKELSKTICHLRELWLQVESLHVGSDSKRQIDPCMSN